VAVVAAALVVNSAETRGDSAPGEAARDALAQARQASDAGRLPEAIEAYKRAYELSGDLSLLFQLGEVNRRLGQDVAAIRFYRSYLARDPRGKYREAAERAARTLELQPSKPAQAAAVAPPAPPVARAPVAPAPVRVAPAPAPVAPAPVRIAPAPVPVVATPAPVTPAPAIAPEPATPPAVDLRADVTATPEPRPRTPLPTSLSWAGLGATIALGAGAIVTGVQANRRYDQLKASCGRTAEGCSAADIDQVKASALTANLLWAATGAGALATGVIVFVNAREAGFAGAWSF
jgi:tetratricopeptide (TPR) repeat protein